MKSIFFIMLFSIILVARENPFEPTQTFLELTKKDLNITTTPKDINKSIITKKEKLILQPTEIFSYNPLKGIRIILEDNQIKLMIKKEYKLLQQIISDDNTKFVFDFKGKLTFYTIRKNLDNKYFNSYILGTHLEDNFFRLVIKVNKNIKEYNITKLKDNILLIKYNKSVKQSDEKSN